MRTNVNTVHVMSLHTAQILLEASTAVACLGMKAMDLNAKVSGQSNSTVSRHFKIWKYQLINSILYLTSFHSDC